MTVIDDSSVFDGDEGTELVRFTEPIATAQLFKVIEPVRRRFVVVGEADFEREPREALDRF